MIDIRKILCPTDFSSHAEHALHYGRELARKFGAELHILHCFYAPYLDMPFGPVTTATPDLSNTRKLLDNQAKEALEAKRRELAALGLDVHPHHVHGNPSVEIPGTARALGVDLIVIATHGHGAVKHALLGSVAENVVRTAPCPVLTIKHPEHDFVKP